MKPTRDFDSFWEPVRSGKSENYLRPVWNEITLREDQHSSLFEVHLTSADDYRISCYVSIPKAPGRHPVLVRTPRYGSVNYPPIAQDRRRYVSVVINHRGQRRSESPFRAFYPGIFIEGIDGLETYVYRGIVADCVNVINHIAGRDYVDSEKICIVGDDLALITAANVRASCHFIVNQMPLFSGLLDRVKADADYPELELFEYIKNGGDALRVRQVAHLFDPVNHAAFLKAKGAVVDALFANRELLALQKASAQVEILESTSLSQVDYDLVDRWIGSRLEREPLPRYEGSVRWGS